MTCTCENNECTQETQGGIVLCTCVDIISDVVCPENCEPILIDDNIVCSCIDSVEPVFTQIKTKIDFNNTDYFEEASWTVSYKPTEGQWGSYFSFKPDYYVNHNNYFQTGLNYFKNSTWTGTLNSHLLTNKSYCVFYGEKYPFIAEIPVKNQYVTKVLESVKIGLEPRRYQNEYDYAVNKNIGFSEVTVYNSTNNSGRLNLKLEKSLTQTAKYPKTNADNTQDIISTVSDEYQRFNYFFNRVKNQDNNVEIWNNDNVRINKIINPHAVAFKGKANLERMRGNYFMLRMEFTDSQHMVILKNTVQQEKI